MIKLSEVLTYMSKGHCTLGEDNSSKILRRPDFGSIKKICFHRYDSKIVLKNVDEAVVDTWVILKSM